MILGRIDSANQAWSIKIRDMNHNRYAERHFYMLRSIIRTRTICFAGLLVFGLGGATSSLGQTLKVQSSDADFQLDGQLNETGWRNADWQPLKQTLKAAQNPLPKDTQFAIVTRDGDIWAGFRCDGPASTDLSPATQKVVAGDKPPHPKPFERDIVELFLDPSGSKSRYYQFALNRLGQQASYYKIERGATSGGVYQPVWSAAVHPQADGGWTAEMRIPRHVFFHTKPEQIKSEWGINATRSWPKDGGYQTWAPLERRFHEPHRFGRAQGFDPAAVTSESSVSIFQVGRIKPTADGGYAAHANLALYKATDDPITIAVQVGEAEPRTLTCSDPQGTYELSVDGLPLDRLGQTQAKVTVTSPQGDTLHASWWNIRAQYQPVTLRLTDPHYRNAIFPHQQISAIAGTVSLPTASDGAMELVKVSTQRNGRTLDTTQISVGDAEAAFSLPVPELSKGDFDVVVEQADSPEGQGLSQTQRVRVLPDPGHPYAYLDRSGNVVINGEAAFVRTWMSGPHFMVSRKILDDQPHPISDMIFPFDSVENMEPHRLVASEIKRMRISEEPSEEVKAAALRRIKDTNRRGKQRMFYYLCDEPENRGVTLGYLEAFRDFLIEHDPYRPVIIVSHQPEQWVSAADIISPDPYFSPIVVPDGDSGKMRRKHLASMNLSVDQVEDSLRAATHPVSVWITPQGFSYAGFDRYAVYPTLDEFRASSWAGIVGGARGWYPFLYASIWGSADMRLGHAFMFKSAKVLEPFLLAPDRQRLTVTETDGPADSSQKHAVASCMTDGKDQLVVVVNMEDQSKTVSLDLSDANLNGSSLVTFREDPTQSYDLDSNGLITIKLAPYQTRLLTTTAKDAGLSSVQDVKQEIAAADLARSQRGNLLFGHENDIEWDYSDNYHIRMAVGNNQNMVDGIVDALGWLHRNSSPGLGWFEMRLVGVRPKFRTVRVWTSTIDAMKLQTGLLGKWTSRGSARRAADADYIEWTFDTPIDPVKFKFTVEKAHPRAEVYEVELLP